MAFRAVSGKDVLLFIDPAGGTSYSLIICLTSNSLKRATSTIDSASKCGPSSSAGPTTVSIDFAGDVVYSPAAGQVAEAELHDLIMSGANVGWKMAKALPDLNDVIYAGFGFISSLDATYDMNGATFSGSIGVNGTPTKTYSGDTGGVATHGAIVGGSVYTNGTYPAVALTGGTGAGATANITVAGAVVTTVTLVAPGEGYTVGDVLSAAAATIGGTGSGFSTTVATII